MLLRHTPKEILPREALTINPAKTCQPIGAMYAALGFHKCLPHSHGSQGCCAYHRSMMTRHYKEPVMATTSSFTEGASVFGGQANLLQAIENVFSIYDPDIMAVHTTCLSETIGDDLSQIAAKAVAEGKVPKGKYIVGANTPSYVGSHVTGFSTMVKRMVEAISEKTADRKNGAINIIPGYVEPSDMAEVKRIAAEMGVKAIVLPDTSSVLNAPLTGKYKMYPKGGTTIKDLKAAGDSSFTIGLGHFASTAAARELDSKCKVPCEILDLPIGLAATDRFIDTLRRKAGVTVPESIEDERGQLVDMIADMHQYLYGKTVAIGGDPDHVAALCEFLISLDMRPIHMVSGTPGKRFMKRIEEFTKGVPYKVNAMNGDRADLFLLHQWIKNEKVDLLMGGTHLKHVARDEDIPLLRVGFPIIDRVGHQYFPTLGYRGAMRLLEKILSALMDRQDRDTPEETFELVM